MKGNESERMKSRHLEEKQTFGRQGVVMQKKEAANVIRRTCRKAGGAQLSNASWAGRARARLWALRAWPCVSEGKHRCTGVQLSILLADLMQTLCSYLAYDLVPYLKKSNVAECIIAMALSAFSSDWNIGKMTLTAVMIVNSFPVSMNYCNGSLCPLICGASSWSQIPPDVTSKLISNVESWNLLKENLTSVSSLSWRNLTLSFVTSFVAESQGETWLRPLWRHLWCASRDWSGSKERPFEAC
jgi:hypothetical protein